MEAQRCATAPHGSFAFIKQILQAPSSCGSVELRCLFLSLPPLPRTMVNSSCVVKNMTRLKKSLIEFVDRKYLLWCDLTDLQRR
jgi:hypothetical protein